MPIVNSKFQPSVYDDSFDKELEEKEKIRKNEERIKEEKKKFIEDQRKIIEGQYSNYKSNREKYFVILLVNVKYNLNLDSEYKYNDNKNSKETMKIICNYNPGIYSDHTVFSDYKILGNFIVNSEKKSNINMIIFDRPFKNEQSEPTSFKCEHIFDNMITYFNNFNLILLILDVNKDNYKECIINDLRAMEMCISNFTTGDGKYVIKYVLDYSICNVSLYDNNNYAIYAFVHKKILNSYQEEIKKEKNVCINDVYLEIFPAVPDLSKGIKIETSSTNTIDGIINCHAKSLVNAENFKT